MGTIVALWKGWMMRFRVIAVTDRRIAVFAARRMRLAAARKHLVDVPRDTDLAFEPGSPHFSIALDGTRYWVNQLYLPALKRSGVI